MRSVLLILLITTVLQINVNAQEKAIKEEVDKTYKNVTKHLYAKNDSVYYYIAEVEKLNEELKNKSVGFNIQLVKAYLFSKARENDKLDSLYALMKAEFDNVPEEKHAFFYNSLGNYYYRNDQLDSAKVYYKKIIDSSNEEWPDYYRITLAAYQGLSLTQKIERKINESFTTLKEMESFIFEKSPNDSLKGLRLHVLYNKKGALFREIGDFKNGMNAFNDALKYASRRGDSLKTRYNQAFIQLNHGDPDLAIDKFKELDMDTIDMFPSTQYLTALQLLNHHIESKHANLAQKYFSKYKRLIKKSKAKNRLKTLDAVEGRLEYVKGNFRKSKQLLLGAIDRLKEDQDRYSLELKTAYKYLIPSMLKTGSKHSEIHDLFIDFDSNHKFISDQEKQNALVKELVQHESELKEEENIKLRTDQKVKEVLIGRQNGYILWGGIGLSLISLLSFLLFRQSSKRKQINQQLLAQKEQIQTLNRELNHRVKNNLAFMTSLLEMQGRRTDTPEAKQVLRESESRLKALSLVHANLFKNDYDIEVNLKTYLEEVLGHLQDIFELPGRSLRVESSFADHMIDAEDAMRIGLIVNELVTNSVKHAFSDVDEPLIKVEIVFDSQMKLNLRYKDNGPGIKERTLDPSGLKSKSMGTKLIEILKRQLSDTIIVEVI